MEKEEKEFSSCLPCLARSLSGIASHAHFRVCEAHRYCGRVCEHTRVSAESCCTPGCFNGPISGSLCTTCYFVLHPRLSLSCNWCGELVHNCRHRCKIPGCFFVVHTSTHICDLHVCCEGNCRQERRPHEMFCDAHYLMLLPTVGMWKRVKWALALIMSAKQLAPDERRLVCARVWVTRRDSAWATKR